MSLVSSTSVKLRALKTPLKFSPPHHVQGRTHSTSPYGRSHVLKRRPNKLPNPVVPQFPQRVIRSDGSTFVHWTTSPRSLFRLTRDLTNNPLWNSGSMAGQKEEEELAGSRVGRFNRRFESVGDGEAGSGFRWMDMGLDALEGSNQVSVKTTTPKDAKVRK